MLAMLGESTFWVSVLQIVMIDILLGGDNAVVIALACRSLPEEQRKKGIFWGVVGAIGLRVLLIAFALQVLDVPFLKLAGGLLLLWIGMKLLVGEDDDGHEVQGSSHLWGAVKTIIVADAVMSFDNVIAVAGASHGSLALVVFGIVISIPIIVWGSQLVLKLMDRFPIVITVGGGLLGWIGGSMLLTDKGLADFTGTLPGWTQQVAGALGAALVVLTGTLLARRKALAAARAE
ncbi:TerC family protein [Vogesella sp. LIG4]|uniref:TerC family protein n=1 Tax=Vogesella sp. LIG4 TaxID=1192162 RepID=UPI0008200960|nr:TerC family protein [Vogesella sp. LIG4]SCK21447.1 integral membrane protein, YjbE family [Vogesella sp. LIG4]